VSKRLGNVLILVLLLAMLACAAALVFTPAGQYARALVPWLLRVKQGAEVVQSAWSPDMAFEAYVVDWPSIDPPNQTLYIQRRDEQHHVVVAELGEDLDSILSIHWAPGSALVVFVSRNFIYAVRTPGYEMVGIPLATELFHYQPGKFSSYGGGIPQKEVQEVSFPEEGVFAYLLKGETQPHTVRMGELWGEK
jgi:hypothetical protein